VNLKVLRVISEAGTNLALPTQTMCVERPGDELPEPELAGPPASA